MIKKQKADYINNAMLYEAILKWKESGEPRISNELGKMTMLLAKKITAHRFFNRYPDYIKEEMYGESCIAILSAIPSFNTEYKNPFAFLTTCAFNANKGVLNRYYANSAKEIRYFLEMTETIDITDGSTITIIDQEKKYRESQNKKKQKKAEQAPEPKNKKPSLF
jgi:hypothetical protein